MDKPLKDWTLEEVKAYCGSIKETCKGCIFLSKYSGCNILAVDEPSEWNLSEPPRWTEQEREDAKTLLRMFCGYDAVERCSDERYLCSTDPRIRHLQMLQSSMFPSLQDGETVKLSEIAGCEG